MRVNFDVSGLGTLQPTGVGVYVIELMRSLVYSGKITPTVSYKISRWRGEQFIKAHAPYPFTFPYIPYIFDLFSPKYDIFHGPDYWVPPGKKHKKVVTIHDLSIFNPAFWPKEMVEKSSKNFTNVILKNKPDRIITVSDFVKQELIARFPQVEPISYTVYHGANHLTSNNPIEPLYDFPYMLYLGTVEARKNVLNVLQAYKAAKKELNGLKWILAGSAHGYKGTEIAAAIHQEHDPDILQLGYVDTLTAKRLLKHALFTVYPSLYEGFGFPILEAMHMGTPVITSNFGAMAEVAGQAALKVDTTNVTDLAHALIQVATKDTLRTLLQHEGKKHAENFTWKTCAEQTLAVYKWLV